MDLKLYCYGCRVWKYKELFPVDAEKKAHRRRCLTCLEFKRAKKPNDR